MMRFLPLLFAMIVGACASSQDAARQGQGPDTAVARFVPGGEVTVIQVTVSDRQAMRGADLVYPDGEVVPAYSIDANRAVAYGQPAFQAPPVGAVAVGGGFGGGGGSFGSAVGITFPIGSWYAPGSQIVYSGQIQSTALVRIPQSEAYRRNWQDAKVRIRIGDPPNVSFVTLPAPSPPAGL
ncbi:MAG: hypothetical protein JO010_09350 [Alphaproteobacteria bacterium]|nr:hypothetical protein [Alphaproteobacteria bacterium]